MGVWNRRFNTSLVNTTKIKPKKICVYLYMILTSNVQFDPWNYNINRNNCRKFFYKSLLILHGFEVEHDPL